MSVEVSTAWNCGTTGPTTVPELRAALKVLARKKSGAKLISKDFATKHIFAGHAGNIGKIAAALASLRPDERLSTYMVSAIESGAQKEVLNWIDEVPANKLTYNAGKWTVAYVGTTVKCVHSYQYATVELAEFKDMDKDDIVKKSRKWLTLSMKNPKVACWFAKDGTPAIYHLDF